MVEVVGLSSASVQAGRRLKVRIVSNFGAENDTLEQLIRDRDLLGEVSLDADFVKVRGPLRNLQSLETGAADLCVFSGLNPLPGILTGSPTRIIGSAMKVAALAVVSTAPDIRKVTDLVGRRIGVGPRHYLLHMATIALLRKNGIDERNVSFVEIGSNSDVLHSVARGEVDAGPVSVAGLSRQAALGVHALPDSLMWRELPEYTNQIMYASQRAIAGNREAIVRALCVCARLFGFLQSPSSWDAYAQARRKAVQDDDEAEARAVWSFLQQERPYGENLVISDARLHSMQALNASLGVIESPAPLEQIADMSMAREAMTRVP